MTPPSPSPPKKRSHRDDVFFVPLLSFLLFFSFRTELNDLTITSESNVSTDNRGKKQKQKKLTHKHS